MSETIAAIATPLAAGGVSMIRVSGERALAAAQAIFQSTQGKILSDMEGYTATHGLFIDAHGTEIDDGIALVYRAPKSYTGETTVELFCHGGIYITREILRLLLENGAVLADAGEFTKRAFLNGKMSLTQAESVMDLIQSRNGQAVRAAKAQMDGALYQRIQRSKDMLLSAAGHLSAWVDFPEEEIEEVEQAQLAKTLGIVWDELSDLVNSFDTGKMVREGIGTAIVGKPNVGKSTLMNLLSGCEKSIVTDIAGTTRDIVEENVTIGNVVLRLADTAGIRETEDIVEQHGVRLAQNRMESAGLILAVFDSSVSLTQEDTTIIETICRQETPVVAVVNKTDLPLMLEKEQLEQHFQYIVEISNKNTDSIIKLSNAIETVLKVSGADLSTGFIANERQRVCAVTACNLTSEALEVLNSGMTLDAVTVLIESAMEALLELTGEHVTEEVVNQVFHNFCVGK